MHCRDTVHVHTLQGRKEFNELPAVLRIDVHAPRCQLNDLRLLARVVRDIMARCQRLSRIVKLPINDKWCIFAYYLCCIYA